LIVPTRPGAAERLGTTDAGGREVAGDGLIGSVGAAELEAGAAAAVEAGGAVGAVEHAARKAVPRRQAMKPIFARAGRRIGRR
jgi:hypothetical protein